MRWTGAVIFVAVCLALGSALRGDEIEWRPLNDNETPKPTPPVKPQPPKAAEPVRRVVNTVPMTEAEKGKLEWYSPTGETNEWTPPAFKKSTSMVDSRFQTDDQKPLDSAPRPRPSNMDPPRELPLQQPLPQPQPMPTIPALPQSPQSPQNTPPTPLPPLAQPMPSANPAPVATNPAPATAPGYTQPNYNQPAPAGNCAAPGTECAKPNGTCAQGWCNGRFGSPNLTITRDYHFLDLFGLNVFSCEPETVVIPEERGVTQRFFVDAEFLLWWQKTQNIPVLASTNSTGLPFLGTPGTQSLLGPGSFGSSERPGFRVRAGAWFGCCEDRGIDGSLFVLGKKTDSADFNSSQFPTIGRPIFAANLNTEFAELTAAPGLATGNLHVQTSSSMWGADVNYRCPICRTCDTESIFFAGYRYVNLSESLVITENLVAGASSPDPVGTNIVVQDSFSVKNQFNGAQIGVGIDRHAGRWTLNARASIALGDTHQELDISGYQVVTKPGAAPVNYSGGLLAVGPNLGSFTKDKFSVVPEATINVGYQFTDHLRGYTGYNFMYWTNVIRPGDQIDRTIDLSNVPNFGTITPVANRPLPTFTQSNLWTQGIQFGLEYKW